MPRSSKIWEKWNLEKKKKKLLSPVKNYHRKSEVQKESDRNDRCYVYIRIKDRQMWSQSHKMTLHPHRSRKTAPGKL